MEKKYFAGGTTLEDGTQVAVDGLMLRPNGTLERKPQAHREVTLTDRMKPVTNEAGHTRFEPDAILGKTFVPYGPAPGFTIPAAVLVEGALYLKWSDDYFVKS